MEFYGWLTRLLGTWLSKSEMKAPIPEVVPIETNRQGVLRASSRARKEEVKMLS